ncbi:hypothetical protein PG996_008850 [Apiospora saccharicola]|uniref:Rhodopsin domain-containing protein n=1 Tax=Apiospora saccharicola TaxID=335842 RepID=A0ABR1UZ42_9PEZI
MAIDAARAAETHLPRILGVSATFHAFALILVACRVYSRACLVKSFGKDDVFIIAGALCVLGGGMITQIASGYHGLGRHHDTLSVDDYKMYTMLAWIQSLLVSSIGMAAIKVSVGCSLLRLSTNRRFCQLVHGLIGFTVTYWAIGFLSVILYCQPIEGLWDKEIRASCYPEWMFIKFGFFNTACNIFTDICFATAPLPLIWSLKLDRRVQLYLVIIFSLGYLAVTMAIAKAVCQAEFWRDTDRTFDHWIQFFGFLEANVSLMAASVPALKPLLGRWFSLPNESCCNSPGPQTLPDRRSPPSDFDIEAELGLRGDNNNICGEMRCNTASKEQYGYNPHGILSRSDETTGIDSTRRAPSEYGGEEEVNGSQEQILPGIHHNHGEDPIRIMKTTQVIVSRI